MNLIFTALMGMILFHSDISHGKVERQSSPLYGYLFRVKDTGTRELLRAQEFLVNSDVAVMLRASSGTSTLFTCRAWPRRLSTSMPIEYINCQWNDSQEWTVNEPVARIRARNSYEKRLEDSEGNSYVIRFQVDPIEITEEIL